MSATKAINLAQLPNIEVYRNRVLAGDFTAAPWQTGTTFTSIASGSYACGLYVWLASGAGVVDIKKTADAPTIAQAGVYTADCLHIDCTTVDSSIGASDVYALRCLFEGATVADFGFGNTNAGPISLSFWVKSTKVGTFCVGFRNAALNRSYVVEYTVSVTNTWEYKSITLNGDTSGTWIKDTTGIGLEAVFVLGCGNTLSTTAGSWQAGNFIATTNQVNAMDSTSNDFKLALVQLERGAAPSPFAYRSPKQELDWEQRYYEKTFPLATAPAQNTGVTGAWRAIQTVAASAGTGWGFTFFMQRKRASPTLTLYNPSAANSEVRNVAIAADCSASGAAAYEDGVFIFGTSAAASNPGHSCAVHFTADARL